MINKKVLAFFLLFLAPSIACQAYWVWSPESGKFVNPEEVVQDSAGEQYDYAMKLYRDRDFDKAIDELKDLVKKNRGSRLAPEAQYLLGVIYEEKGDYLKAFDAYKVVLESYPQTERFSEVVEREYRIANLFLSGRKGKLMGLEILPSLPRAAEIFEHIVKHAPYSDFGDKAQFRLGITRKQAGQHEAAMEAFQQLIDNYPQSDLVADARYQLAETAFLRSNVSARDQRALESASTHVDRFLMRYPDTSATEKASKLRQEIDEKNAEKNFRIGAYYEKTNYVSSAVIYYKDIANRYPHTQWGKRAAEKLQALEEPVSYVSGEEARLQEEIKQMEAAFESARREDSTEKDALKRKLDRLKQKQKFLEKNKEQSMKAREEDLKRREREWGERAKNLERKKKLLETNTSEDFKKAMDRWSASLEEERETLEREKQQLRQWKESLGMSTGGGVWSILPFVGEEASELDTVRRLEAKKLYKVSDEKRSLLEEKELLYKQYHEVAALLGEYQADLRDRSREEEEFLGTRTLGREDLSAREQSLRKEQQEIERIEKELREKNRLYKERYGESAWASFFSLPAKMMTSSAGAVGKSLNVLNPFAGREKPLEEKSLEELTELRMHLREKIAAGQAMTETLSQAFDDTLAMQTERQLLASLEAETEVDVRELRKQTRQLEKEIRKAYEEIGDRHGRIKKLAEELDQTLTAREAEQGLAHKSGRLVTAPARTVVQGTRDFIFGRKPREAVLTDAVKNLPPADELAGRAKRLREEIELESLLIESRNREIYQLRRQLDILKAKASLAGGQKFRSSIVTIPYEFIEEAVESARSIIPREARKEALIHRLDDTTKSLEIYKRELAEVESIIQKKAGGTDFRAEERALRVTPGTASGPQPASGETWLEEELLREEIHQLSEKMEKAQEQYAKNKSILERERSALDRESGKRDSKQREKEVKEISARERELRKELRDLDRELAQLIQREKRLEEEEAEILGKRISKIDQFIHSVRSKAMAQDLLTERSRLEDRLSQIESRQNFLATEQDRFQLTNTKVV